MRKSQAPLEEGKKPPTEFQLRARKENLKKAQAVNADRQRKKELAKIDVKLNDLSDEIETSVEKQVKERLGKLNRKKLKDEVLRVFYDMGGTKAMKRWAKKNPDKYYNMLAGILKSDTEKDQGGGGGVTVNIFDPGAGKIIDVTPDKQ